MTVHRLVLGGLLVLSAASSVIPVQAQRAERGPRARLGAAVAPVRLVSVGGGTLSVSGLPDYFGEIRLGAASDGLVVVNRLPLERYLLGLAEVPSDWPSEALKAQAVAARTYALYTLSQPRAGAAAVYGFDICASIECQVFSGAEIVQGADGARWREAVEGTARQTVLYEGAPILARYHSTSGGRTLDNPDAFETEAGYPYLQGVTSTTEQGSPLYRWSVRFRLRDLQRIVERAGLWTSAAGRLTEARSVPSNAGRHFPDVVLRGTKGRVRLSAEELRSIVRDLAPRLFPALYPSPAVTSSGRLPETFPSNRIEISTARRLVLVRGRGWGHGVGMSQWGAHGMALRGASYADILRHYYTGVELGPTEDPGAIDVGVAWARSVVDVTGDFRIVDGKGRT
ncbi:MAG: SpoIID/LytB domain-containing protein, partial [Actinomycetota bacterium]